MAAMNAPDPVEMVQRGYDHLSHRYRGDEDTPAEYTPWLTELQRRLPAGADVLDLGCGCGIPVAKTLADHGHRVTGVDLSEVQIDRARQLVPRATFLRADATRIAFADGAFDVVVCLYTLIHMPLDTQPQLLNRIAAWLRPGGVLLATTGSQPWTGSTAKKTSTVAPVADLGRLHRRAPGGRSTRIRCAPWLVDEGGPPATARGTTGGPAARDRSRWVGSRVR
jgi:SAM-dependent methyltransferase